MLSRYRIAQQAPRLYLSFYRTFFQKKYRNYVAQAYREIEEHNQLPFPEKIAATEARIQDMVNETLVWGTCYEEYFTYRFDIKDNTQRRKYILNATRDEACRHINQPEAQAILLDKYRCSQHFKDFYGRPTFLLSENTPIEEFLRFTESLNAVVVKPLSQCAGRGVHKLEGTSKEDWQQHFEAIQRDGGNHIIEGLIPQAEELGQWHPNSLNTIRAYTLLVDGKFTVFGTFLRCGRGGSFIDNCCAGGLMAAINSATGRIFTTASDVFGNRFDHHPDSGLQFFDAQIPHWDSLLDMLSTLAHRIPELGYVAWDMALTPSGWVMVEGNKGQFFTAQLTLNLGLQEEFNKAING